MKVKIFYSLVLTFFLPVSYASNQCIKEHTSFDICEQAVEIADATADQLPMQISQNLLINSVHAIGNVVQFNVIYAYDKAHLEKISEETGVSMDEMIERTAGFAQGMCHQDMVASFVRIGGGVRFVYLFSDGEKFTVVTIDECP